jgi:hypothetical protein
VRGYIQEHQGGAIDGLLIKPSSLKLGGKQPLRLPISQTDNTTGRDQVL